ncbi:hypothetical protein BAUCODRAFT_120678 [Baudoinia panamericana UAMH 10762]|uniref:Uncharacterized protein n=1 Tax=Baudoinia panamericana (strain UAMH 10762) TaxID=717646 RepID=M2NER6_BAUPA|nr:uncharacterized protein BAUCODRAFT_120678 [Baudoinia panamericana UAMH 10762]EMC97744.1 hypothetical protein BAUCODRAFT_120678 [Baudoinia panamericana UAMH 10762]
MSAPVPIARSLDGPALACCVPMVTAAPRHRGTTSRQCLGRLAVLYNYRESPICGGGEGLRSDSQDRNGATND